MNIKYNYIYNRINIQNLNFKDFLKKRNIKHDITNEFELQRCYDYPIYPRDSKLLSEKDLKILMMDLEQGLIGFLLQWKITYLFI